MNHQASLLMTMTMCRICRHPNSSLPLRNHPVDEHEASVEGGVEGLHVADDAVRPLLHRAGLQGGRVGASAATCLADPAHLVHPGPLTLGRLLPVHPGLVQGVRALDGNHN